MLNQLDKDSEKLTIDNRILVLRNRSVGWLWNAFQAVNNKELVQKVSQLPVK